MGVFLLRFGLIVGSFVLFGLEDLLWLIVDCHLFRVDSFLLPYLFLLCLRLFFLAKLSPVLPLYLLIYLRFSLTLTSFKQLSLLSIFLLLVQVARQGGLRPPFEVGFHYYFVDLLNVGL